MSILKRFSEKQLAIAGIFFTTAVWGFAFIAVVWCLKGFSPGWLVATRFAIAVITLSFFAGRWNWRELLGGFWPGFFLFSTLFLQTLGLKTTTATKSGFVTTLYVLFIPILEALVLKKRLNRTTFIWIGMALIGTALICQFDVRDFSTFNIGDFYTLLCAFLAACHLIASVFFLKKVPSAVRFNLYQSFWISVLAGAVAFIFDGPFPGVFTASESVAGFPLGAISELFSAASAGFLDGLFGADSSRILWSLFFLGTVSSAFAFMLVVRAQKVLPPTTVGLLCLLESPFAAIFSVLLLGEQLSLLQLLGGGLILIAASAESWMQAKTV